LALDAERIVFSLASVAASLLMFYYSARIVAIDWRDRLYRGLALFLFLRAFQVGLLPFIVVPQDYATRTRMYFFLALPGAALYVGLLLVERFGRPWPRPARWSAQLAILGGTLALEALYIGDHSLALGSPSPLDLAAGLDLLVMAFIALFLLLLRRRAPLAVRTPLLWVSLGFAVEPAFLGIMIMLPGFWHLLSGERSFADYATLTNVLSDALHLLAVAAIVVGAFVSRLGSRVRGDPQERSYVRFVWLAIVLGFLESLAVAFRPYPHWWAVHYTLVGAARMGTAALIGYAVVRHRALEAEVRFKVGIRRSVAATVFVAVFFVVAEVAANQLSDQFAFSVGGAAAGLLLFAIHPIQRWAERVANHTVPGAKRMADLSSRERRAIYEEQATLAWLDGSLERKERLLLDGLRERLALGHAEAEELERRAMAAVNDRGSS
jgi:hypothetical protein